MTFFLFTVLFFNENGLSLTAKWKRVDTWEHDVILNGIFLDSVVDDNQNIAVLFMTEPIYMLSKNRAWRLAPLGKGPGDIIHPMALFIENSDLAVWEMKGKIKVFSWENNGYSIKHTIIRKATRSGVIPHAFVQSQDAWFVAGSTFQREGNKLDISILKVYEDDGAFAKDILTMPAAMTNGRPSLNYPHMFHHLKKFKDRLYLVPEYDFEVFIIDPVKRELLKKNRLKPPPFYKSMPKGVYQFDLSSEDYRTAIVTWRQSYTRIENFAIVGDTLLLQVRTARPHLSRFAMLSYSLTDLQLKEILFVDDFFLAEKDGILYFLRHGEPSIDDEAGQLTIDLYVSR